MRPRSSAAMSLLLLLGLALLGLGGCELNPAEQWGYHLAGLGEPRQPAPPSETSPPPRAPAAAPVR